MKKVIILICLFIILANGVTASENIVDNLLSTERIEGNLVCNPGELPVIDSDCNNQHNFFYAGWFWKVLLIGFLFIFFFVPNIFKSKIFWGCFVVFLVFVYFISSQQLDKKTETFINTNNSIYNGSVLIVPESSFQKTLDTIVEIPENIAGKDNQAFGLFILTIALFLGIPLLKTLFKKIEEFVSK